MPDRITREEFLRASGAVAGAVVSGSLVAAAVQAASARRALAASPMRIVGLTPAAGTTALTVAADGTGDFCTVQGAVDFGPAGNTHRVTISVRPGTYTEIVYVGSSKPFITIAGQDRSGTVVQYANNNTMNGGT